jgi:superfamily I DNA/RNA helicase
MAHHGIATLPDYLDAERIGRAGTHVDRRTREIVFAVRERYHSHRGAAGKLYDWDDLASAVTAELNTDADQRLYRHIVIDEGQDFSPEMIRSLSKAIPPDGSLTFFGDVAQQIYGSRMSWRSAGLQIAKVWNFRENYRNSKQIARLGLAISRMPYYKELSDMVEPISPTADGPPPTLVQCSSREQEVALVVAQAQQAARTQSVAILFRSREDEQFLPPSLRKEAIRLHREMTTWQAGPGIRYGTYHAAKGLEFDFVLLPCFSSDRLPDREEVSAHGDEEAAVHDGRLVYVATTRAKTRLVITYTGNLTSLMPRDAQLYELVVI